MLRLCLFALSCLLVSVSAASAEAPAAACPGAATTPWVRLRFAESVDAALAREALKDLRAELAPRGFAVCGAQQAPADAVPLASVEVAVSEAGLATVRVSDSATHKRLARDVPLHTLPTDGRALGLALAVDELLRASWAELSMRGKGGQLLPTPPPAAEPEPEREPEPEAEREPEPAAEPEPAPAPPPAPPAAFRPRADLSLGGRFSLFSGGQRQPGGELAIGLWLAERWRISLDGGGAVGLVEQTGEGDIAVWAVRLRARVTARLWQRGMWSILWTLGPSLSLVTVEGRAPNAAREALRQTGYALFVNTGPGLYLRLSPSWRLSLWLEGGAPLRGLEIEGEGGQLSGISGVSGSAGLGVGVVL